MQSAEIIETEKLASHQVENSSTVKEFMAALSNKPLFWFHSIARPEGITEDIDVTSITAIYAKESDIPLAEIEARKNPENHLIDGYLYIHFIALDSFSPPPTQPSNNKPE